MKIRNGFVSNSSSSSFIIGVKNKTELTEEDLMEVFKVPNDSILFDLSCELAGYIMRSFDKIDYKWLKGDCGYYIKEKIKELGRELTQEEEIEIFKEESYMKDYVEDIINNKIVMYQGSASYNEADGAELILGNMSFNIETDTIVMKGGGDH